MKDKEVEEYYKTIKESNKFNKIFIWLFLTPLVYINYWQRKHHLKPNEWYWADLILMKNGLSFITPYYAIKHFFDRIIPHLIIKLRLRWTLKNSQLG